MELERLRLSHWYLRWVEHRANSIADPVRRLRYLRRALPAVPRRRAVPLWVLGAAAAALILLVVPGQDTRAGIPSRPSFPAPVPETRVAAEGSVWLVESRENYEMYSNGLRIETRGAVTNEPRVALTLMAGDSKVIAGQLDPAGIVFHTTESHIAPFEPSNNLRLQRVGNWLRDYVTANRSYHYVIDRFGRVYRIVRDSDVAYHAGSSLWATTPEKIWINLNHSFLGVAFESETAAGDRISESVTPAQIRAAATLTAMLRWRYNIDPANCVTHAQVSINPANMRIGLHTDWGANFPFAAVDLPDNYAQPLAAIYRFGFIADDVYRAATGSRLARGIDAAELTLQSRARQLRTPPALHRQALQQQFRKVLSELPSHLAIARGERKEKSP
jgi:hypothetical protein